MARATVVLRAGRRETLVLPDLKTFAQGGADKRAINWESERAASYFNNKNRPIKFCAQESEREGAPQHPPPCNS
jgi:hypothetical protein